MNNIMSHNLLFFEKIYIYVIRLYFCFYPKYFIDLRLCEYEYKRIEYIILKNKIFITMKNNPSIFT